MAMANVRDESYWCEQVFHKFEFSVVRLHTQNRFKGNGFILHAKEDQGLTTFLIVTCKHVLGMVQVGETMDAHFSGSNDPYNARVLYADQDRDLALLRVSEVLAPAPVTPLRFFDQDIVSGWNVIALSFIDTSNGEAVTLQPGTFSGQIINEPGDASLNCSCSSKIGASGSPIILAGVNEVVAVLAGSSLMSVDAIPLRTIKAFLCGWLGEDDLSISISGIVTLAAVK